MTLNISVPTTTQELRPKITVIGVGGAGGNAVNNMISANLEGVDFLVANTDGQALAASLSDRKIQLGRQQTQGLGAGSAPEIGRVAAQESLDDILAELTDSHMVFITAGMGGGTGTGAAPVIAKAARERGILTVGVVTKPFDFEGPVRMRQANSGIEELQAYVDTLIIIPNQNLFRLANERTTLADAFAMADDVLHKGVSGVTDLMIKPGNINLDFADIRSVMSEMGKAMMGTGEASGEHRAANAAEAAINNPLLDETTMNGAQAVLINITGGPDMTLFEVDEAANHIRREVDAEATIIFGSAIDEKMEGIMRVSVVATGMEAESGSHRPAQPMMHQTTAMAQPTPVSSSIHASSPAPVAEMTELTPSVDTVETTAEAYDAPVMDMAEIPAEAQYDTVAESASMMAETADHIETMMLDTELDQQITEATEMDAEFDALKSDEHQHDLVEMVEEARAEMQAEMTEQLEETEATAEDETVDNAPFTLREIAEIPEETKSEEVSKPNSLIGHLTGMFGGRKTETAEKKAEPEMEMPALKADDGVHVMGVATPDTQDSVAEQSEVSSNQPERVSGLASLKPTPQPKLNIDDAHADVDLDIPAFLRRQAN